jgi:signal transduction histidine kinase
MRYAGLLREDDGGGRAPVYAPGMGTLTAARPSSRWPSSRWQGAAGVAGIAGVLLLTVIGCYVEANPAHSYGGLHLTRHPPAAGYLLVALPAVALAWRDRAPVAVFAVAAAAAVGWAAFGQIDGAALVPVLVAIFWVALTRPWRIALAAGLTGAVVIFVTEGTLGPFGWLGGPNATMWPELLAAGAFGGYVAARRQWLAAERDRAARAAQLREDETRRRVDAERMRIARELHDVVAHSMAMINVQATAAAMLLAEDPDGTAAAIQAIRGASKSGLRELRAILQVLREADGEGTPKSLGAPGLRDIHALADATTAAGTHVTVRSGDLADTDLADTDLADTVPPPVALAAYRIVQESLTNVVRHASGAAATVAIRQDGDDLLVEISNGAASGSGEPGDGAGAGLPGMRERAAALGGTLAAGPRPGGGFEVRATLPLGGAGHPLTAKPDRVPQPTTGAP